MTGFRVQRQAALPRNPINRILKKMQGKMQIKRPEQQA
jgi:hypothetical protein